LCLPQAERIVARAVGAPVRAAAGVGNNAEPQCVIRGARASATVNLDSSPQPYQRLERAIVELGQQFGTVREVAPPETIAHLGLDAAWIPSMSQVLTSDGRRLITITIEWPHTPRSMRRALAIALARVYL
jgi:hypothetical protein